MRITTLIREDKWQPLEGFKHDNYKPYWLRLNNGNIVLASKCTGSYGEGWYKASINHDGSVGVTTTQGFITKDAEIQPATL